MEVAQQYELQDLLQVRLLREDAAARELANQKTVVENVEKQLQRHRQELTDYQTWRVRREEELFEEIVNQRIHHKELEKLRFRIQQLRDEESRYQANVLESEARLQTEKQKLEEVRQQYFKAYHQRDKLDEHKALWTRAARQQREWAEEKEVEDFKNRMASLATEGE